MASGESLFSQEAAIVHMVKATDAAVANITQLPDLLHGQEREVFGDQASRNLFRRKEILGFRFVFKLE
jgi:hypothetical protein